MKNSRTTYFIFLLLAGLLACKKEEMPADAEEEPQAKSTATFLENAWWTRPDSSEHCLFTSGGRFFYIKGPVPVIDTIHATTKGNWNWMNSNTLNIAHPGVLQGTCTITKLVQDTLRINVNTTSIYPYTDTWVR